MITAVMAGAGLFKTALGAIQARNVKIPQYEIPQSAYQAVDATRAQLGDNTFMAQGMAAIKQQQAQALYNQQRVGGSASDAMLLASQLQGGTNQAAVDLAVKNSMRNMQATQAYTQALNNLTQQEENKFKYAYQTAMEEAKATSGMIGSGITDFTNALQTDVMADALGVGKGTMTGIIKDLFGKNKAGSNPLAASPKINPIVPYNKAWWQRTIK